MTRLEVGFAFDHVGAEQTLDGKASGVHRQSVVARPLPVWLFLLLLVPLLAEARVVALC